jgi:alkanesulfonate monooxygenase SsuD/methylene tetrahydromethanopterin reductase-like flavin-dependent oxidoreductase (luciferase family)
VFIAATFNPQSFADAGGAGHHLMIVPYVSTHDKVAELLQVYRDAWAAAGHTPGDEQIHLSYHCYVSDDAGEAYSKGKEYFEQYKQRQLVAVGAWTKYTSEQYPGYEHLTQAIRSGTYEAAMEATKFFIGTPDQVARQIEEIRGHYGNVEPSLQVNFGNMPQREAIRTVEMFARDVMPAFREAAVAVGR